MSGFIRLASIVAAVCGLCGSGSAVAQKVDHYSPEALTELAKALQPKAVENHGAASETLEKYGADYTMLSFRSQDGTPEQHEKFADIFVVVAGSATLLSGGELVDRTSSAAGEWRGGSILHPVRTQLGKGDVVHIPPNTPHQLLIPRGGTFTYFVVKVRELD